MVGVRRLNSMALQRKRHASSEDRQGLLKKGGTSLKTYGVKTYRDLTYSLRILNNGDGTFTDVSVASGIRQAIGKGMGLGTHGTTYGGNPLAMAVGIAALDLLFTGF